MWATWRRHACTTRGERAAQARECPILGQLTNWSKCEECVELVPMTEVHRTSNDDSDSDSATADAHAIRFGRSSELDVDASPWWTAMGRLDDCSTDWAMRCSRASTPAAAAAPSAHRQCRRCEPVGINSKVGITRIATRFGARASTHAQTYSFASVVTHSSAASTIPSSLRMLPLRRTRASGTCRSCCVSPYSAQTHSRPPKRQNEACTGAAEHSHALRSL